MSSEVRGAWAAGAARGERAPFWTVGLSALLIVLGFARQRSGEAGTATRESRRNDARPARSAEIPSEIPPFRWKDVLLRVYHGISEDRILLVAAGVTFYALLAIFPGIAALISIYGLFADPGSIAGHLDTIANVAPGGAIDVLREQMTRLASQGGTTLGLSFLISLAVSLWTANSGVTAIFDALNIVNEAEETRGYLRFYAVSLLVTIGIIVFILLTLGAVVALPIVLNYLPLPGVAGFLAEIGRWPLLFGLATVALQILYKYGPSRSHRRWRWVTPGSMFAALAWLAASVLFSWYVANFGSYNKTYGSLGAIIGFMTWIWISIVVVLIGAKLDAEIERQTARQSIASPRSRTVIAAAG